MAITGVTIPQLPAATDPTNTWTIPVDSGTGTFHVTLENLRNLLNPASLRIYEPNWSGSVLTIPANVNGGKLPIEDTRIRVYFAGSRGYDALAPLDNYSILRNTNAPDAIQFTNPVQGEDLLIEFDPI